MARSAKWQSVEISISWLAGQGLQDYERFENMDSEIVKPSSSPRPSRREVGDPPQIGRVERISRSSVPKRRHSRGGRSTSRRQHKRKLVRGITISIFLLTLLAVLVICSMWLSKRQKMYEVASAERLVNSPIIERVESRFKSPSEDETLAIVNKSIAASDEATVKANFRLGSTEVGAALQYLKEQHAKRGEPSGVSWLGSIDVNDMLVEGVMLNWKNGEKITSLRVFLTPNESGVWQVDFDSFADKCSPGWHSFISGEAVEGMVRVWFSSDNYYNGPFFDESKWVCYAMARPESDQILLGYCRVGSSQAAALAGIMQRVQMRGKNNAPTYRTILELSRPEGAERRQYEIKRVLAEDWILSDKVFDGAPLR
jgi:hypothetical protein